MTPTLPPPSEPSRHSRWRVAFKIAFTVAIFVFLFSRIDIAKCGEAIRQARSIWLLVAFVTCSIAFITSTLKWHSLLAAMGVSSRRWALLKVYAIGNFISSFLPGTVGGDLVRCRLIGPTSGGYVKAAASILMERLTGVIAMVLLAAVSVLHDSRLAETPVLMLVGAVTIALAAGLTIAMNRRLATVLIYRTRRSRIRRALSVLYRLHRVLRTFPRPALAVALGWSLLFYLGSGALLYFSCLAFSESVSFVEAASVAVVVCLLMLVPISVGGLGLRQAGDVYLLGLMGIEPASALVISLLRQMIGYAYTLIGGFFFVFWQGVEHPEGSALHSHDPHLPAARAGMPGGVPGEDR